MVKKNNLGLGKGLDALFSETNLELDSKEDVCEIEISKISPDENQHRKTFIQESLDELASSIALHGILQPIIVKKAGDKYKIIAGERRFRAAKIAKLEKVPVIIKDLSDKECAEIALIENLQREDLNPVDEAKGYESLIKNFGITQEEAADRVGKSRSTVTNSLRLLRLPESCLEALRDKKISAGHARAILSLKEEPDMNALLQEILEKNLSVRETERRAGAFYDGQKPEKPFSIEAEYLSSVSKKASDYLARKVVIKPRCDGKKGGKIVFSYSDSRDLETFLEEVLGENFIDTLDR